MILNTLFVNNKKKLKPNTFYFIIKRNLFKAGSTNIYRFTLINNTNQALLQKAPTAYLQSKSYATHRVFTPKPTTSSQEGLNNNPPVSLHRAKGDVLIQHPELAQTLCVKDNCKEFACQEFCDEPKLEEQSIGLLTHTNKKGGFVISDTDIDGVPSEQVLRTFETPHKTTGESANEVRDQKRTENLQKMLIEATDD